ncbi:hypothetical protein Fmac_027738 [Flemingia macrophylla]|uniref:Glycine-rich protein n=1 Tax=Flemingia macrophylla TaxID=520843 RepID=A0ABD1LIL7_9FABA
MGKCCYMLLLVVLALATVFASARNMPSGTDATLEDQKNVLGFGFSGVDNNGLPFAGVGTGFDAGNLGGPSGLGGFTGFGGPSAGLGGFGGPATGGLPNLPLP